MAHWCIDAGHGGADRGFIAPDKFTEADYTLNAALVCKQILEENGEKVTLTRNSDVHLTINDRVTSCIVNKCDFMISIHMNGDYNNANRRGVNCYIFDRADSKAVDIAQRVVSSVYNFVSQKDETNYEGINEASFGIMKYSGVPTIIIEGDYVTNINVRERFKTDEYGKAIAYALIDYIKGPFELASYAHPDEVPRYNVGTKTDLGKLRELLNIYGYRDYMDNLLKITDDNNLDPKLVYALSQCILKKGQGNKIVKFIRDFLAENYKYRDKESSTDIIGYDFEYKESEIFDDELESLIKKIQKENKMNPTGVITCKTWITILTNYCK